MERLLRTYRSQGDVSYNTTDKTLKMNYVYFVGINSRACSVVT